MDKTELLTIEEVPFESYEELVGTTVMAPWYTADGVSVSYSEATVLSSDECNKEGMPSIQLKFVTM